jgi:hypothetical protein
MATYGAKALTRIAVASQANFGTAASIGTALGEILFNDTIGSLDLGITVDLGENVSVGKRTAIQASQPTITAKQPMLTIAEAPASLRTLPIIFDSIGASTTGSGPYLWSWSPTQGDVDTLLFSSFLVTDGVQKYLVQDAVPTEITISADANSLVQAGATYAATVAATSSLPFPTAIPTNQFIPGRLMRMGTVAKFPTNRNSVTNVVQTTTTATITTAAAHGYTTSDVVSIALLTGPTGYAALNGTFTVASAPTSTTFTITVPTGTITTGAATGSVILGTDFASIYNFSLSITTGVGMVTALDGSITAATAALTGVLDATLTFTVASNSAAITSFPITAIGTQKYLRLNGQTADSYGLVILGSWTIENVVPLSADTDGVVVNEITARLAYDTTSGKSLEVNIFSPLATAP